MSCSLDSNCKLTLVVSTSACNTSWKNLSSLGHALSELSEILVINFLDSVSTEHTNLLAWFLRGTGISFLFHDFSSYRNKVKLTYSERNVAVTENFLKIAEVAVRHTVISSWLLRSCLLWRSGIIVIVIVLRSVIAAVILITAAVAAALIFSAYELNIINENISGVMSYIRMISVLIAASSEAALNADEFALIEITGNELSSLSPCCTADEISLSFACVLICEFSVASHSESA